MGNARNELLQRPGAGIMFHHFHGRAFPAGQGSISAEDLADIIEYVGRDSFLLPDEWLDRAKTGRLASGQLCLTFDDGLSSQTEVALPVLDRYGLKAFWFVCSAPLTGAVQRLGVYKYYRDSNFLNPEKFYLAFEERLKKEGLWSEVFLALSRFDPQNYLVDFPFYTNEDRRFRYLRDEILGLRKYYSVMDSMIEEAGLDPGALSRKIFFDETMVKRLHREGHRLGLHTHTHPTRLDTMTAEEQRLEYCTNRAHLEKLVGEKIRVMSHPSNAYSEITLTLLQRMGLDLGFRSNMAPVNRRSPFEYPREDHTNLIREMSR